MTNEEIQSMAHEIMGLTDDITGLMIWIAETIEPVMKENKQLKNDLKVARRDRENLQIEVGKGLQEYIKDCPYTALEHFATSKVVEENEQLKFRLNKAKEMLPAFLSEKI